jgi:hypothetical protein
MASSFGSAASRGRTRATELREFNRSFDNWFLVRDSQPRVYTHCLPASHNLDFEKVPMTYAYCAGHFDGNEEVKTGVH